MQRLDHPPGIHPEDDADVGAREASLEVEVFEDLSSEPIASPV